MNKIKRENVYLKNLQKNVRRSEENPRKNKKQKTNLKHWVNINYQKIQ